MRSQFDKQLAQLHRELIEMGALCEQVIALSSQALTNRDTALAEKVAPLDHEIDRKERDIENLCLRLLLQLARDLAGRTPHLLLLQRLEQIAYDIVFQRLARDLKIAVGADHDNLRTDHAFPNSPD